MKLRLTRGASEMKIKFQTALGRCEVVGGLGLGTGTGTGLLLLLLAWVQSQVIANV